MENKIYIVKDNPYEDDRNDFFLNMNEMLAMIYLAALSLRTIPKAHEDFFNGEKKFRRSNDVMNQMQHDLINLKNKKAIWKNEVIEIVANYIDEKTYDDDFLSPMIHFYAKEENHTYFLFHKFIHDLAEGVLDDPIRKQIAISEFKEFTEQLAKEYEQNK